MFAARVQDRPVKSEKNEINEFYVSPPRCPAYAGQEWKEPLASHLRVLFPDLIIHISVDGPFRSPMETAVVPMVGRLGVQGDGGWFSPITDRTNAIMAQIVEAVDTFELTGPARMN